MEQQKKARPFRREFSKPSTRNQPFNKGSSSFTPTPKPTAQSSQTLQRTLAHQKLFPPQNRPNPSPLGVRIYFKCQGLSHIVADCPNLKVITLAEWEVVKEEKKEIEPEVDWSEMRRKVKMNI